MLIIIKDLLAKISDAFWCALNAQVFDQFSCCRDFLSGKFAVWTNLDIASWLEFKAKPVLLSSHYSVSASNLLTLKFALDPWRDPQFSASPKAIHFAGEVFGELW